MRHVGTAGGIIANHHNRYIGRLSCMHGGVAELIGSIVDLDVGADFIPDSIEWRNRMRRCAAVPIPVH